MVNVFSIAVAAMDVALARGNFGVLADGVSESQALALFGVGLYAFATIIRRVIRKRELRRDIPLRIQQPEAAV
jgi:hypothetical protein